jgi:hypothetical protein
MERWRWASRALIAADVVMTVIGLGIGVWLVGRGDFFAVVMGAATLVFVPVAAALSFWARQVKADVADAPVHEALERAVKNARTSVRIATASLWTVVVGLSFTAIIAFARGLSDSTDFPDMQRFLIAIGATQVWLALVLGATIVYYQRRQADLTRLEQLRDAFRAEV